MPRLVEEELVGYAVSVLQGERPATDERGNPIFNGMGQPKTEPIWMFAFVGQNPDGGRHVVKVIFGKDGKDGVVKALTGGLEVASQLPGDLKI